MGKTHKALKEAEDRYRKLNHRIVKQDLPRWVTTPSAKAFFRKRKDRYGDLKKNLLARGFDGSPKTILFINTFTEKNGSEDYAFKFSASLTQDLGFKVLFIDLDLWTLSLQDVFKINYTLGLSDLFSHDNNMASGIKKVGPGNLYTMRLGREDYEFLKLFESGKFKEFLKNICDKFNYIVFKAPATASFQECRVLCSKLDAVVLVLKAGTNTAQIIRSEKNIREYSADKLLGMIIHKTKNYRRQFTKTASVFLAISLILTVGLLIGNGYLEIPSKIKNITMNFEKSTIPVQPKHPAKGTVLYDSDHNRRPEEKINTQKKVVTKQIHELPQQVKPPIDTVKEKSVKIQEVVSSKLAEPIVKPKKDSDKKNRIRNKKERVVVVQKGETLFRIIYKNYGTYNNKIASLVLRENPKIKSPKHIVAGQSIKLPELSQLD